MILSDPISNTKMIFLAENPDLSFSFQRQHARATVRSILPQGYDINDAPFKNIPCVDLHRNLRWLNNIIHGILVDHAHIKAPCVIQPVTQSQLVFKLVEEALPHLHTEIIEQLEIAEQEKIPIVGHAMPCQGNGSICPVPESKAQVCGPIGIPEEPRFDP